jgi:uncharacterized glyoxalase superfamily protein PhnB
MSGDVAISLMLAVPDAPAAAAWYMESLGANELWSLGSVIGLKVEGAPFFLAEPEGNGWSSPSDVGTTTVRVEIFVDDPDSLVARAVTAGADGTPSYPERDPAGMIASGPETSGADMSGLPRGCSGPV